MKLIHKLIFLLLPIIGFAQDDFIDYREVQVYEIGGINVSGTEHLDVTVLRTLSGLQVGDEINIPGQEIPDAIKALWKQGLFADVQIDASKTVNEIVFLDIILEELPRLSRYKFNGINKTEAEELRDELKLLAGRIVNQNIKNNSIYKIERFFKGKGFLGVQAAVTETPDTIRANSVIVTFDIDKGKRVKIDEIDIIGNRYVNARQLKKRMKGTNERTKFGDKAGRRVLKDASQMNIGKTLANVSVNRFLDYMDDKFRFKLFSSSKLEEDKLEEDKAAMIAYYNSKGFRDARIISDSIYYVDENKIVLQMRIEEGPRYYFGDIAWSGNTKYTDEQLMSVLNIDAGDVYNSELLNARLFMDPAAGDVSSLYMDDGYLFFNVEPIETAVMNDSIDLQIRVSEGPEATINKILISGNDKTNEHVIRRELRTLPGSKFRRSDIMRSQRQIAGLNYFNQETIGINPIPNPADGTVDIEYTVEEKPSDKLELSAGFAGRQILGNLGVTFNNFSAKKLFDFKDWSFPPSGDGQQLSLTMTAFSNFLSFQGSFTEPWLGGKKPMALSVGGFHSKLVRSQFNNVNTSVFNPGEDDGVLSRTGGYVSLGYRLPWPDDFFTLSHSINVTAYDLKDYPAQFIVSNGKFYNISLTNTLTRSSVDAPIYPRRGSNISLSVEATLPYSRIGKNRDRDYSDLSAQEKYKFTEYVKTKFKAEWYTTLVQNLVLKTSAKMGWMNYYSNDIGYAPFERFELGGDGFGNQGVNQILGKELIILRGYEVEEVNDNRVPIQGSTGTASVGNPFYNKFTVELRYPFSLNPSATIFGLVFVEGGNAWSDAASYNPFNLKRSVGVGVRAFLPMFGLIGFDFGIGFDKFAGPRDNIGDLLRNYNKPNFYLGFEPE